MLELTIGRPGTETPCVLFLGAHCDDIEIGCGGTILHLRSRMPQARLRWVILSSDAARRGEALASARRFLGSDEHVRIESFRDGFLPHDGAAVKERFEALKREIEPDVIFTHYRHDRHQDHRLVSELAWNTWRDHLILEYEIPKYDGDLGRPNAYVSLSADEANGKVDALLDTYPSQRSKHWYRAEVFRGLMALRGVEARAPEGYAEAFFAHKLAVGVQHATKHFLTGCRVVRFIETKLAGAYLIELESHDDERGSFARTFCERVFGERGLATRFVQCNVSFNRRRGTVRGMHYQLPPHGEAKLVRCTAGAVFDAIVDLRPDSPTRFQWTGVELDALERHMLYVPEGFAHGFQTLCDGTEVFYQMSAFYAPEAQRGFRYDDAAVGIRWPEEVSVISERDLALPPARGASMTAVGERMMELARELFPICRSITGDGVRRTLRLIQRHAPLEMHEVPSGTRVLDWTVPDEWNIRDAWIKDASGRRVVDFHDSNLHVVSYSEPVRREIPLAELREHLHTLPDHPERIPYRTSYYDRTWGFCIPDHLLRSLADPRYEVCIDSTLEPGSLTYGEVVIPGEGDEEIIVTTHVCHPSLANDNISGIVVATFLAAALAGEARRSCTVRVVFAPGTIGAITWLARNRERGGRIRGGLTLACLGGPAPLTYKQTVGGTAVVDRAAAHVLNRSEVEHEIAPFTPFGFDERQFNAPGFRLPVGGLTRGGHDRFDEGHSSADDLDFISIERLGGALDAARRIVEVLERNRRYRSLVPYGEPQLGRRGLYRAIGGTAVADIELALLWVLNLSDGEHDTLAIAERSGLPFDTIARAADLLVEHGLLEEASVPPGGTEPCASC